MAQITSGSLTIVDVTDGAPGLNNTTVFLYRRAVSAPDKPTGNLTYTFSTASITGALEGWVQSISELTGSDPIWMIAAVASSNGETDVIGSSEWAGPIKMAQNGQDGLPGTPGTNGLNQATIFIYKRDDSATAPSDTTYTFATGDFTVPGWSKTIPTEPKGKPCWITSAIAISAEATVELKWATPSVLVEDGSDGVSPTVTKTENGVKIDDGHNVTYITNGKDGTSYYTFVRYSENSDGSGYVDTPTSETIYIGVYTGTKSSPPAYNDSGWTWSRYVGADGQPGTPGSQGPQGVSVAATRELYYLKTNSTDPAQITNANQIHTTDDINQWTSIVPTYIGSGKYYTCIETTLSNGNVVWSAPVENKGLTDANVNAANAIEIARGVKQHFFWVATDKSENIPAGAYVAEQAEESFYSNPTKGNILTRSDGIWIRNGADKLATLQGSGLTFLVPTGNYKGQKSVSLNGSGLTFYNIGSSNSAAATLASDGLEITNGSIVLGTTSGTDAGNVTLSNKNFERFINGTSHNDLRFAIGSKFGVASDGTLYSSGLESIASQVESSTNLLIDSDAPNTGKVYAALNRYFSNTLNTEITCSSFELTDPPENGFKYGRRFVYTGTATTGIGRGYAFYYSSEDGDNGIPYMPNTTYTATWWARCTEGKGFTRLIHSKFNGTGGNSVSPTTELTSEWQKFTYVFTTGSTPNTNYNRLWFEARFTSGTAGTVEICGCKLVAGDAVEQYKTTIEQTADSIVSLASNQSTYVKPDGTTATNEIASAIAQNANDITLRATKTEAIQMSKPNLSPFFQSTPFTTSAGYWTNISSTFTPLEDGWAHFSRDNTSGTDTVHNYIRMVSCPSVFDGESYTCLVEIRNLVSNAQSGTIYTQQSTQGQFWGATSTGGFSIANDSMTNGSYYMPMTALGVSEHETDGTRLMHITWTVPAGAKIEADIRISLYEGEYTGEYKPYVGAQMYASQAELKVANDNISSKVSTTDYNGATIASLIEQSADSVKISANHINVQGVITAINNDTTTTIDGDKITTGSITAEQIKAHSIGASHLVISDSTNLAVANEAYEESLPTAVASTFKAEIRDGYLTKKAATQEYLMLTDYTPSSFKAGDELYYEFYGKAETAGNIRLRLWGYKGIAPTHTNSMSNSETIALITEEKFYSGTITLTDVDTNLWSDRTQYLLGFDDIRSTKSQIYIRKCIIRRKNGGELIVDGSVKASAIDAESGVFSTANIPELKASHIQTNVIEAINDNTGTVQIKAEKVAINGTATFNAIKPSADATYDAIGAADIAKNYATAIYGTSSTNADVAAKVVTLADFKLYAGAKITVKFTEANTSAAPTLNVNSTVAKAIYVNKTVTSASNPLIWAAGAELHFTYDGTYWNCDDVGYVYSTTCSVAAATAAKTGAQTGAIITNGTTVTLTCTNANTVEGAITFNFASTGAATVYKHNAATASSNALIWSAGSTLTLVRRGQYWYYAASTTIDGDNITTGKIKANLGGSYLDLDSGDMFLGDASTYDASTQGLMWNESAGSLKIKGQITVESGSNVYTTDDINPLEIGGRNLILDTATQRTTPASTNNSVYVSPTPTMSDYASSIMNNTTDKWTYSFDYTVTGNSSTTAKIYVQIRGRIASGSTVTIGTTQSGHYSKSFTLSSDQATTPTSKACGIRMQNATDGAILTVKNIKLEKGNKETDWSSAPEDYITDIDGTGIRVHPSNSENNSVVINSEGMEIFRGGTTDEYSVAKYSTDSRIGIASSGHVSVESDGLHIWTGEENSLENEVAFYGDTARIGSNAAAHLLIEGNAIQGIASNGYTFFDINENGTAETTTVKHILRQGYNATDSTIDLSAIPLWTSINTGQTFTIETDYYIKLGNTNKRYSRVSDVYTKGTSKTNTYSSYTKPNTITISSKRPAPPSGSTYSRSVTSLKCEKTVASPFYSFGIDSALNGGSNSFAMGLGTIAPYDNQFAVGKYNDDTEDAVFMVGYGFSDSGRYNVFEVDQYGNVDIRAGATYKIDGEKIVPEYTRREIIPTHGSNYSTYGGSYYEVYGKVVHVHIGISGITASTDTVIYTLPSEYRPSSTVFGHGTGGAWNNLGYVDIRTDGEIHVRSEGTYCAVDITYIVWE